jgi:hypothetical protein
MVPQFADFRQEPKAFLAELHFQAYFNPQFLGTGEPLEARHVRHAFLLITGWG